VLTLHDVPSLEQLHGLLERTLDLGILRKPEVRIPAGIKISEWYRAPLVVAIQQDHPLARRPSLSLSQLKAEPFVTYPREAGTGLYWQILDICAHAGFRPRVAREVLEPSTIIGLVAAGVGVAIVPDGIQCIQLKGAIYKRLTDIRLTPRYTSLAVKTIPIRICARSARCWWRPAYRRSGRKSARRRVHANSRWPVRWDQLTCPHGKNGPRYQSHIVPSSSRATGSCLGEYG
jgi:DNA-binding transcriptional LysR family regulator